MRGRLDWAGNRECDWSFLSHEVTYFKGLGITKEDLTDEGVPVISYGQIHAKSNDGVHLRRDLLRYIPRTLTNGNEACRLRRGDIVFADTSEDIEGAGNCILIDTDDEVYAGYHTLVARPKNQNSGAYLARLFQSAAWRSQIQSRICGIKVFSITRKILKGVSVLTPTEESQRKIVAYLDEKSAAIDARVAVLEKKLAAYKRLKTSIINRAVTRGLDPKAKLKDSGVEWIGKVPAGWDTRRVKDVGSAWNGLTYSPEDVCDEDNGVLVFRSSNIQDGRLDYTDCVYVDCNVANLARVKRGDVLICSRNGSAALVGKNALIETDVSAAFGAFMLVFRGGREIEKRYAHYVFNAQMFESYMGGFATSTIHQLLRSDFLNMEMPYPPPAEQIAIADYLDAECAKIDKMAELVTREIELYKKLKRSLINEVVTGKREVA